MTSAGDRRAVSAAGGNVSVRVVVAGVIRSGESVLLAQRPNDDPLGPRWEFPGGKVEYGESPEESLRRELLEELAIQVEVGGLLGEVIHDYGTGRIRLIAYEVLSALRNARSVQEAQR